MNTMECTSQEVLRLEEKALLDQQVPDHHHSEKEVYRLFRMIIREKGKFHLIQDSKNYLTNSALKAHQHPVLISEVKSPEEIENEVQVLHLQQQELMKVVHQEEPVGVQDEVMKVHREHLGIPDEVMKVHQDHLGVQVDDIPGVRSETYHLLLQVCSIKSSKKISTKFRENGLFIKSNYAIIGTGNSSISNSYYFFFSCRIFKGIQSS